MYHCFFRFILDWKEPNIFVRNLFIDFNLFGYAQQKLYDSKKGKEWPPAYFKCYVLFWAKLTGSWRDLFI